MIFFLIFSSLSLLVTKEKTRKTWAGSHNIFEIPYMSLWIICITSWGHFSVCFSSPGMHSICWMCVHLFVWCVFLYKCVCFFMCKYIYVRVFFMHVRLCMCFFVFTICVWSRMSEVCVCVCVHSMHTYILYLYKYDTNACKCVCVRVVVCECVRLLCNFLSHGSSFMYRHTP